MSHDKLYVLDMEVAVLCGVEDMVRRVRTIEWPESENIASHKL